MLAFQLQLKSPEDLLTQTNVRYGTIGVPERSIPFEQLQNSKNQVFRTLAKNIKERQMFFKESF